MKVIIYTTNTGSTERYAKLLSNQTGMPAYSLAEAKKKIRMGTEIIYLGWIMAGSIKGYADAAKRYKICAACAVGMGLANKQDRTAEEDDMLDMMLHGGERVSIDNLRTVFDWYGSQK